jgi:putative ABC transport system permease protein
MSWPAIFYRLIVRPLLRDPLRTALTAFAVSLGVSVVVAIDLASEASVGEFRTSMEMLTGDVDLEIASTGGIDESVLADLVRLPYPLLFSPRVEGFGAVDETGEQVAIFGLDLIGDETLPRSAPDGEDSSFTLDGDSAFAGERLGVDRGDTLRLRIDDSVHEFHVGGKLAGEGFQAAAGSNALILDIAVAQRVLGQTGRLTRIQVQTPDDDVEHWRQIVAEALPAGVSIVAAGSAADENRKMLGAFSWNLRVLSGLSLIVGALLVYNTIAVSVVRRRSEIGVLRALGASRNQVRGAFLTEAAFFGVLGSAIGLGLGRVLAEGAVAAMTLTVQTLYVSGDAGEVHINGWRLAVAAAAGLGVALLAAWQPASEAARVAPSEAMARGRNEHQSRTGAARNLYWAFGFALVALGCALAPAAAGLPVGGYAAVFLLLASSALAVPAVVQAGARSAGPLIQRALGVEGMLGARSIGGSLARTSILVAALSTAVAMMVSIAIMVGSFRDTVALWMERQFQADLYMRAAGRNGSQRFAVFDAEVAESAEALPGVAAVERFRGYPIRYEGRPATLGLTDASAHPERSGMRFFDGASPDAVFAALAGRNAAAVSEPFARKHDVWAGDRVTLDLRGEKVVLDVAAVFYEYANESGSILADRTRMMRYLPDESLSSLAIYLEPQADAEAVRERLIAATAGRELLVVPNRTLQEAAMTIFDRTFSITYALEAVAIFVAVLGMAGALLALVIDRKREFSVLRFLGASSPQIRKLILVESGLLGMLSIAVGAVVGALLSLILIYVINVQSFGWTIQFHWPVALLAGALGLIYAASVLAGLYPARVAARLNPIEAVHEE